MLKNKTAVINDIPQLGEIYYAKLPEGNGSAQSGIRPCVVAQNAYALKNCSMVWVIPLTKQIKATHLPVHVLVEKSYENGLKYNSMALLEDMTKIPKKHLFNKIGKMSPKSYFGLGKATLNQFPLTGFAIA